MMRRLLLGLVAAFLLASPSSAHDATGVNCWLEGVYINNPARSVSLYLNIKNNAAEVIPNPYMEVVVQKSNGVVIGSTEWRPASLDPGQTRSTFRYITTDSGDAATVQTSHCHRNGP